MKTKTEIIEHIEMMNLQNMTEKSSFDRAYKQGIEDAVNDLIELNLLIIGDVSKRSLDYEKNKSWNEGYRAAMKGTEYEM